MAYRRLGYITYDYTIFIKNVYSKNDKYKNSNSYLRTKQTLELPLLLDKLKLYKTLKNPPRII